MQKRGDPLQAQVWLPRVDNESIDRRHSDELFGRARRLLDPGKYYLVVSLEGYETVRDARSERRRRGVGRIWRFPMRSKRK